MPRIRVWDQHLERTANARVTPLVSHHPDPHPGSATPAPLDLLKRGRGIGSFMATSLVVEELLSNVTGLAAPHAAAIHADRDDDLSPATLSVKRSALPGVGPDRISRSSEESGSNEYCK